jgi:hypothetical protein
MVIDRSWIGDFPKLGSLAFGWLGTGKSRVNECVATFTDERRFYAR